MFLGRSIVCAGYYVWGSAYPLDPKWVYPRGVGERGGGAGDKAGGANLLVNLTMSSFYGIMEARDFRIT